MEGGTLHTRFPFVGSCEHTKSPQRTQFRLRVEESERWGEVCCTTCSIREENRSSFEGRQKILRLYGGQNASCCAKLICLGNRGRGGGKGHLRKEGRGESSDSFLCRQ